METNPRGIPKAPFFDNVDDYLRDAKDTTEETLKKFDEMLSKYRFMEVNMAQRKRNLNTKMPDIKKTLDVLNFMIGQKASENGKEGFDTQFSLADTLYASAHIAATDKVNLWLGANVMVEYPIQEAQTLLHKKLSQAENSLKNCEEDLKYLKEQSAPPWKSI